MGVVKADMFHGQRRGRLSAQRPGFVELDKIRRFTHAVHLLFDIAHKRPRDALKFAWCDGKDGFGASGCAPNGFVLKEVFVHHHRAREKMAKRRHPARGVAGLLLHVLRLSHAWLETEQPLEFSFSVNPVCAAGDDDHRGFGAFKHNGFRDVGDVAPQLKGCIFACSRSLVVPASGERRAQF